jgi:hypothetical protein
MMYAFIISPMRAAYFAHLILLHLIVEEEYLTALRTSIVVSIQDTETPLTGIRTTDSFSEF